MARVLVVGWELPERAPERRMEAANYRTWQLVQPLLDDAHAVALAAGRIGADFASPTPPPEQVGRLTYQPLRFSDPRWIGQLQRLHDQFQPDSIVGVTFLGALRASRVRTHAPRWYDIYGDQLAEMQAAAHQVGSDRGIATQLRFYDSILKSGDAFSTCGASQRFALIGQLSMAGRLNAANFGFELVRVIPPGAASVDVQPRAPLLRGRIVPAQSHVILWCGGYNAWTDVDTLYRGLSLAMRADPLLHFVSVGGELAGCDAYARLRELIDSGPEADRFHLLGWQPVGEVSGYYADADIAVTLDAGCYEAELGTRTRLVEMMQHGLPIVTTRACDLSSTIQTEGLGLTFPIGDARAMAEQLLTLSRDDGLRQSMSRRARAFVATALSLESSTLPLREWVQQPRRAPDLCVSTGSRVFAWTHTLRSLVRGALWGALGLDHSYP